MPKFEKIPQKPDPRQKPKPMQKLKPRPKPDPRQKPDPSQKPKPKPKPSQQPVEIDHNTVAFSHAGLNADRAKPGTGRKLVTMSRHYAIRATRRGRHKSCFDSGP